MEVFFYHGSTAIPITFLVISQMSVYRY